MRHRLATLLAAALLAGCGGGLYIVFGGGDHDLPPAVSLALASTTAAPGQVVRLVAAATDDDQVVEVDFYRVDPNGDTSLLGRDEQAPFDWNAVVPADALRGSSIGFFARAVDSAGQRSDSSTAFVTVR
jgi:hypothetical protein